MNRNSDHTAFRIDDVIFENFINNELLPQLGISQQSFSDLLHQLVDQCNHSPDVSSTGTGNNNRTEKNGASTNRELPGQLQHMVAGNTQSGSNWGSLYSALYQENAIPHCAGLKASHKTNPARSLRVTSGIKDFLDIAFPLTEGSHHDVTSYLVYFQNLMMILADGSTAGLQNPAQFVAKIGPRENPESILLLKNGLHVELSFDPNSENGSRDLASIDDVQIETIESARSDLNAATVAEKCELYQQLIDTAFSVRESDEQLINQNNTEFTSKSGDQYEVSNQGQVVYVSSTDLTPASTITDNSGKSLPADLVDTFIAALITTSANRCRLVNAIDGMPRIIVASDNAALTMRVLNLVEKACKKMRLGGIAASGLIASEQQPKQITQEFRTPADTRAERNILGASERVQTDIRHCPINKNEKATTAGISINHAVLFALHNHGFELARLSRGLPGNNFGEQQLSTQAFV